MIYFLAYAAVVLLFVLFIQGGTTPRTPKH